MKGKYFKIIFIILVFIFLYLPIGVLIAYSFNSGQTNLIFEEFSFKWYLNIFKNTDLVNAFLNTLLVAVTSTVISTVIGTISAYGLYKFDFPFKKLINSLVYIPIVIPEIVLGISLLSIYTLMKLELSIYSIILSHIAFSIPFVVVNVKTTLTSQTLTYEEAAKDLGASNFTIFKKIIMPIITPGIVSGATLVFTLSMDDVVISYFTAGPGSNTLPLYIYSIMKSGITPDVNALTSILLVITFVSLTTLAVVQSRKLRKEVL